MAVITYKKSDRIQLSKNFNSYEIRCGLGRPCSCQTTLIDEKLVEILQMIRDHWPGHAVHITSGYRCPAYNRSVGGATGSYHSKGMAADITVDGVAPREVAKYAESIGVLGIGLYETQADGFFVHVDTRTAKSYWYGQKQVPRTTFGGQKSETTSGNTNTQPSGNSANGEASGLTYTVASGDTLAKIAARYPGITYKMIADANGIKAPYMIQIGQKLTIPTAGDKTSAEPTKSSEYATADYDGSPEFLWKFFLGKLCNAHGVAGLLGNLNAESNLIAANLEMSKRTRLGHTSKSYTEAVDSGAYKNFAADWAGYGIAQWTDSTRKGNLLAYAQQKSASIGNRKMQAEFLMHELETRFTAVLSILKNAKSVREASDAVLLRFECPADTSESVRQRRAAFGDGYYQKFANANVVDTEESASKPPYFRTVTASLLNVRQSPTTASTILRQLRKGAACTIVEEKDGWGRLSDGGWVCLDYVQ